MRIWELIMLVCFGVSWPFNLMKSIRTRSAKGKSPLFLFAIWIGYIAGIVNKILYSRDYVMWVYALNFLMVSADIVLYFRNRRLDAERDKKVAAQSGPAM